jgi:hypothetical protein
LGLHKICPHLHLESSNSPKRFLQGANFPASIDAFGGLLTLFDFDVSKEAVRAGSITLPKAEKEMPN